MINLVCRLKHSLLYYGALACFFFLNFSMLEIVASIKDLLIKGFGIREISRNLNINVSIVSRVKNNKY